MNDALVHHFPPELMSLLVNAIPRLIRGKQDLLIFFKGCEIPSSVYADLMKQVRENRQAITKYAIVRTILERLNDKGDAMLRARRLVLKRVTEWEDFSTCYDNDRMEAQGYVAEVRRVVNVKDSFTRMNQERESVEQAERQRRQTEASAKAHRREEQEKLRAELNGLIFETDAAKRGLTLEGVLNRLFKLHGILLREAFKRKSPDGEGTVEQIDGVIEIDARVFLVEMKWWAKPLGKAEIAQHLVRVYNRPDVCGMVISNSGYTKTAVASCREALAQKTFVLAHLSEIILMLEREGSLLDLLKAKLQAALVDKNPITNPVAVIGD